MRVDAFTHFIPPAFFDKLVDSGYPDIGKRMRGVPSIHDLDVRMKVVDTFPDYGQLLTKGAQLDEFAKIINDGFADICAKHRDHFPGWVAQISLDTPDAGVAESERAIKNGALGVQIYSNIAGRPLDDPAFEP